jgi:guanosine-3',5'-bis(diphosphate) 3'-pyrophosphohydrolase
MSIETILAAASFSARKHRFQTRKGAESEPYINHPLEVANLLANIGGVTDPDIILAGLLHDTIEDTETTAEELTKLFGTRVASIVLEVTDDKTLPKAERKLRQIEHAPHISPEAKQVKLADKISNITDVIGNPPHDWPLERRQEYVAWGEKVVAGLRGSNPALEAHFDDLVTRVKRELEGSR